MIRKLFSIMAAISLLAALGMGGSQRNSVAAQTLNNSRGTAPDPQVVLDITSIELFGSTSMAIAWTAHKNGFVKQIDGYTITVELSRSGVKERVAKTAGGASAATTIDLSGISAANRAKLFGSGLKVTVILKANFTARVNGVLVKTSSQIQEAKSFNASPIEK